MLFGQYSMADPTRAPAGKETAWAYSHVLPDADAIEAQIERHAPGFGALVRGRRVEHLPPGRINLGTARARNELFLRPFHGRPETGIPGVFLGSASAHPGGAVHGAPGWIAAQAALRSARSARALADARELDDLEHVDDVERERDREDGGGPVEHRVRHAPVAVCVRRREVGRERCERERHAPRPQVQTPRGAARSRCA